jgi:hypothetical protein
VVPAWTCRGPQIHTSGSPPYLGPGGAWTGALRHHLHPEFRQTEPRQQCPLQIYQSVLHLPEALWLPGWASVLPCCLPRSSSSSRSPKLAFGCQTHIKGPAQCGAHLTCRQHAAAVCTTIPWHSPSLAMEGALQQGQLLPVLAMTFSFLAAIPSSCLRSVWLTPCACKPRSLPQLCHAHGSGRRSSRGSSPKAAAGLELCLVRPPTPTGRTASHKTSLVPLPGNSHHAVTGELGC